MFIVYLIIFSAFFSQTPSFIGAFILGMMKDLWEGERLGVTSLVYVVLVVLLQLYKRKFNAKSPVFLAGFSSLFLIVNDMVETSGSVSLGRSIEFVGVSVGSVVVWFIIYTLCTRKAERGLSD